MAITKDDQNTFLMIGGVLIICLIALIAVASSIWSLIRQPVNSVINTVTSFIRVQTLDYNFAIPVAVAQAIPPSPNPAPPANPVNIQIPSIVIQTASDKDIDYNFQVGNTIITGLENALISDSELLELGGKNEPVKQTNLSIQIPSIGIDSPILQGLDSESLLKQGFTVVPSNKELGKSEIILLCNRRYFGPNDPKSCWFLDKIVIGNIITIKYEDNILNYKVVGSNSFKADDPLVYNINQDEDLIRIVTTDPLYSNENRLVILAERVN